MAGKHRRPQEIRPILVASLAVAIGLLLIGSVAAALHLSQAAPSRAVLAYVAPPRAGTGAGVAALDIPTTEPVAAPPMPATTPPPTGEPAAPVVVAPPPSVPSPTAEPTVACSTKALALPTGGGGVRGHVAAAGRHIVGHFGLSLAGVLGVGSRSVHSSDHPLGLALDFMVSGRDQGDAIAQYALDHQEMLAVKYVIWRQRINHGDGWSHMEDRGSATANHFDHVHISFNNTGPDNPILCEE